MINFQYLRTGVYGLANAYKAGTMAGRQVRRLSLARSMGNSLGFLGDNCQLSFAQ